MAAITTRAGKGSALTHNEVDANFNNLNSEVITAAADATQAISDAAAAQTTADDHIADASAAHAASAISVADVGALLAATDVEAALAEIAGEVDTNTTGLSDHIGDATAAHAASAIGVTPAGGISSTDVQAALEELDTAIVSVAGADTQIQYNNAGAFGANADFYINNTTKEVYLGNGTAVASPGKVHIETSASTGAAAGGTIEIWAGAGAAGGGAGGNVTIYAGGAAANTAGHTYVQGGSATGGNNDGGVALVQAGNGFGSGAGAATQIVGGAGGSTGIGGNVEIQAGAAGATGATGGNIVLTAGAAAGGTAGYVDISTRLLNYDGTAQTWSATLAPSAFQINTGLALISPGTTGQILQNCYYNASHSLRYQNSSYATMIDFGGGQIILKGATSGTAGNAVTMNSVALFDGSTQGTTLYGDLSVAGDITIAGASIPQNSQSTGYTLVASDANKHILHPSADTSARTFTIPANASVAFEIGTAITFVNQDSAGTLTIAITSDTMRLAGAGTTGSRTLAANGVATALKITSTEWIISGTGLT